MSKAEPNRCLDTWSMAVPTYEDSKPSRVQFYDSEEDFVAWPPIIARIRDLDKPLAPEISAPASILVAETKTSPKSIPAKISASSQRHPNISSRWIAFAGIIIFLCAIVPFMHFRDSKSNSDTTSAAWQPGSPAPNADVAPAWPGGTAKKDNLTGKTSSQPLTVLPTSLTNKAKPENSATSGVPPLMPLAEKKESMELMSASPLPTKTTTPIGVPVERVAALPAQPTTGQTGAYAQPNASELPTPSPQPSVETYQVTEIGEYSPLPNNRPAKAENGQLRSASEYSNNLPPANAGYNQPQGQPNQPMVSGAGVSAGVADLPQAYPNVPSPYAPPPAAIGSGYDNRGNYQADARIDNRRSWQYTPSYRSNSQPDYRTNPSANGTLPLPNRRTGAMPPQASQQYYPNQPTQQAYPANQPIPSNPLPGAAAGMQPYGGGNHPPAANNNYPGVGNPGVVNPGVVDPNGYHFPAATENPPIR
jgi:hypothetical protein